MKKYQVIKNLKTNCYLFYNWDRMKYDSTPNIADAKLFSTEKELDEAMIALQEQIDSVYEPAFYEVITVLKLTHEVY